MLVVMLADSPGGCAYFEHIACIHEQAPLFLLRQGRSAASTNGFPLPGERARVRGREYESLAILYRKNRWQGAQIKEREASASLSCYPPLVTAFNRFWFRP
ncbi:hypothetical protein CF139_12335 [Aeromonas hydrophila]|nr:hypothetical protein CF139_12335 [Aeromonas hydrophila]